MKKKTSAPSTPIACTVTRENGDFVVREFYNDPAMEDETIIVGSEIPGASAFFKQLHQDEKNGMDQKTMFIKWLWFKIDMHRKEVEETFFTNVNEALTSRNPGFPETPAKISGEFDLHA